MKQLRLLLLACWAAGVAQHARADSMTLDTSPAVACLAPKPKDRTPVQYPEHAFKRKDGGTVVVDLTFAAPDKPPRWELVETQPVEDALVEAVEAYVEQLRVPCLPPGAPAARMRFEFVFEPSDGRKVIPNEPVDLDDKRRAALSSCMRHVDGLDKPEYPRSLRRQEIEGKVYVRMTFKHKDQPPSLEVIARSNSWVEHAIKEYTQGLRLPCLGDEQVAWKTLYEFEILGTSKTVLSDLTLRQFLSAAKLPPDPVYFDFAPMQCPFDLRIDYLQPFGRNVVRQVETSHSSRTALMDWLKGIELKVPADQHMAALGESFTLSVPCGKLDL